GACERFSLVDILTATNHWAPQLLVGDGYRVLFKGVDPRDGVTPWLLKRCRTREFEEFYAEERTPVKRRSSPSSPSPPTRSPPPGVPAFKWEAGGGDGQQEPPQPVLLSGDVTGMPLTLQQRLDIVIGVARGLEYLHSFGIEHFSAWQHAASGFPPLPFTLHHVETQLQANNLAALFDPALASSFLPRTTSTSASIPTSNATSSSSALSSTATTAVIAAASAADTTLGVPMPNVLIPSVVRLARVGLACTAMPASTRPSLGRALAELEIVRDDVATTLRQMEEEVERQRGELQEGRGGVTGNRGKEHLESWGIDSHSHPSSSASPNPSTSPSQLPPPPMLASSSCALPLAPLLCQQVAMADVLCATARWAVDRSISSGGFGDVYLGVSPLDGCTPWAVKRARVLTNDFRREVCFVGLPTLSFTPCLTPLVWCQINEMASKHHPNLVRLLGFCMEYDAVAECMEQIAIYEFMPHGDLHHRLHGDATGGHHRLHGNDATGAHTHTLRRLGCGKGRDCKCFEGGRGKDDGDKDDGDKDDGGKDDRVKDDGGKDDGGKDDGGKDDGGKDDGGKDDGGKDDGGMDDGGKDDGGKDGGGKDDGGKDDGGKDDGGKDDGGKDDGGKDDGGKDDGGKDDGGKDGGGKDDGGKDDGGKDDGGKDGGKDDGGKDDGGKDDGGKDDGGPKRLLPRGGWMMEARMMEARMMEARMMEARMMEASMMEARMMEARMMKARMMEARMMVAMMMEARMMEARMMEARMMEARMIEARMIEARMMEARMMEARMMEARMMEARMMDDGGKDDEGKDDGGKDDGGKDDGGKDDGGKDDGGKDDGGKDDGGKDDGGKDDGGKDEGGKDHGGKNDGGKNHVGGQHWVPMEKWSGKKPLVNMLRVFGLPARSLAALAPLNTGLYHFILVPFHFLSLLVGSSGNSTPLTLQQRLDILIGVARALEYLHSFGIMHRDVKPTNILLDAHMQAKLADFGLLRPAEGSGSLQSTRVRGTPGYVDPVYSITHKATPSADVYSFGVVMMELLTCKQVVLQCEDGSHLNIKEWVCCFCFFLPINNPSFLNFWTNKLCQHKESDATAQKQHKGEENPKAAADEEYGESRWGTIASAALANPTSATGECDWLTLHQRMGHAALPILQQLVKNEVIAGIRVKGEPDEVLGCPTCMQAKFTGYLFSSSEATARRPLDEVVMDIVGPLKLGAVGAEYFLTIVDVYTRMTWVYDFSKKSDVAETVKTDWLPMVERQQDRLFKSIRADRGGDVLSKELGLWLKKNCIRHSLTMPYSHAMNGIAERANRTITETSCGLLIEAGLPDNFWPDVVRSACLAKNRALTHVGAYKWVPYVDRI
ncbi:unnamed protein product, partial [Closterium sp. NIES-54]